MIIQIGFTEQELFDTIMAVYSASSSETGANAQPHEIATAVRRKSILDKLHDAFERNTAAEKARAEEADTLLEELSQGSR